MFQIEIKKKFNAYQGLKSPVRNAKGLSSLVDDNGFSVTMTVGIQFEEAQLNERGWFVDTDAMDDVVDECVKYLASDKWTVLFEFRPTFELVAKWSFDNLAEKIPQLVYIELNNATIDVSTRYTTH